MAERELRAEATSGPVAPARAVWTTPALRTLGDLSTLTRKVDLVGITDGGSGTMKRT